MHKGYKSERAFYNAKLHGLAVVIYGESTAGEFLKDHVYKIINKRSASGSIPLFHTSFSVTDLTDKEARQLYFELLTSCKKVKANSKVTDIILGIKGSEMSDAQRKRIIKLTKYNFNWAIEVTFSKILEFCPDLVKRLTPWQIQNTKIQPLFNLLTKKQADKIIKRLEKIERRNQENEMS